jgi:hypothetical protein
VAAACPTTHALPTWLLHQSAAYQRDRVCVLVLAGSVSGVPPQPARCRQCCQTEWSQGGLSSIGRGGLPRRASRQRRRQPRRSAHRAAAWPCTRRAYFPEERNRRKRIEHGDAAKCSAVAPVYGPPVPRRTRHPSRLSPKYIRRPRQTEPERRPRLRDDHRRVTSGCEHTRRSVVQRGVG